ncbi:hypothetical protein DAMNIGENAA_24290 [Desulforhabdus amnigena]|uniref:Uncharacterized protein n=1 Tax=Desulforhabdus amnigena TaxID=40218 RepID=A0A9W6L9B8_9BACT|nr:hypothetical protein DAMNIGENAA_24290 [Desulforhabdus amnigena]
MSRFGEPEKHPPSPPPQGGNFKTASKGVDRFQYPFIHHGGTEGTEKILEFLWNFSAIFVPPW